MAKASLKLVLDSSRDIPLDLIALASSNVRHIKKGVTIEMLADDIDRRGLLHGLNVRPTLDAEGQPTGRYHVPAGGRRYLALHVLVKRKRLARNAPVPCVVKDTAHPVSEEEDSLAENTMRERLHPLDEFRAMQRLAEQGNEPETIAAVFTTTAAVVRQRLKLASVSPKLHQVYADDGMTLDQLMAFTVSDDQERQEQVWELLTHSINRSPSFIRARLTEGAVRASDRRAKFVGIDAYVQAGGCVLRDLFEDDDGGWLQDAGLLDRLVGEKLLVEAERISAEGWKWVAVAIDLPYGHLSSLREIDSEIPPLTDEQRARIDVLNAELQAFEAQYPGDCEVPDEVNDRVEAIEAELSAFDDRAPVFDPADVAIAGTFVSLEYDGSLYLERGWVRPEDEPVADVVVGGEASGGSDLEFVGPRQPEVMRAVINIGGAPEQVENEDEEAGEAIKPLPDRLVSELTAHRTLALQDALAENPSIAFGAVLHALVLSTFYHARDESCLGLYLNRTTFPDQSPGMKDSPSARSIAARQAAWKARLPNSEKELWDALVKLDAGDQAALFAHCAAYSVNALWEVAPKYDNGRISAHGVERRIAHSNVLAQAVGLDMVAAGWRPTVENYLGRVTKPRILMAVTEAKGEQTAGLIDHLKKGDMAREAERLLEGTGWLAEPLRAPETLEASAPETAGPSGADAPEGEDLPAFLDGDGEPADAEGEPAEEFAVAAE